MSKFLTAVLLIALGLGIGLWLGFDPEARAAVQENYARANETFVQIKTDLAAKTDGVRPQAEMNETKPDAASQDEAPLAQVPKALEDLWAATKQLWASLVNRIEASL